MITKERIGQLATQLQTSQQNIVREYCQHLFLSHFYSQNDADKVLFKGGTALRIVFKSPRFSEDLDFSAVSNINKGSVENLFTSTLADIEKLGIRMDFEESKDTLEGYLGIAIFQINSFAPVKISIEVSFRDVTKPIDPEPSVINSDFVPTYTLFTLPLRVLVQEKMQALLSRHRPGDFYDVYIILRSNYMKPEDKKVFLPQVKQIIATSDVNFKSELEQFLPADNQQIIRDFKKTLMTEIDRNLGQ